MKCEWSKRDRGAFGRAGGRLRFAATGLLWPPFLVLSESLGDNFFSSLFHLQNLRITTKFFESSLNEIKSVYAIFLNLKVLTNVESLYC